MFLLDCLKFLLSFLLTILYMSMLSQASPQISYLENLKSVLLAFLTQLFRFSLPRLPSTPLANSEWSTILDCTLDSLCSNAQLFKPHLTAIQPATLYSNTFKFSFSFLNTNYLFSPFNSSFHSRRRHLSLRETQTLTNSLTIPLTTQRSRRSRFPKQILVSPTTTQTD
jgi:hypothetical protein